MTWPRQSSALFLFYFIRADADGLGWQQRSCNRSPGVQASLTDIRAYMRPCDPPQSRVCSEGIAILSPAPLGCRLARSVGVQATHWPIMMRCRSCGNQHVDAVLRRSIPRSAKAGDGEGFNPADQAGLAVGEGGVQPKSGANHCLPSPGKPSLYRLALWDAACVSCSHSLGMPRRKGLRAEHDGIRCGVGQ